MNEQEFNQYLFRNDVVNKVFDVRSDVEQIRTVFLELVGVNVSLFDKYIIAERQLKVTLLELENLQRVFSTLELK